MKTLKPGDAVVFHEKVFSAPYTPYYDDYRGHAFEVVALHEGGHVQLKCVDEPTLQLKGYPHDDELIKVNS